jgi:hypothetical protein
MGVNEYMKNKLPKRSNKYLYLNNGDIIRAGDEYWSSLDNTWSPVSITIGTQAIILQGESIRRKLPTNNKTNKNQPNVRRYSPQTYYDEDNAYVEMDRDSNGSYINYEDYLKLHKQVTKLKDEVQYLNTIIKFGIKR